MRLVAAVLLAAAAAVQAQPLPPPPPGAAARHATAAAPFQQYHFLTRRLLDGGVTARNAGAVEAAFDAGTTRVPQRRAAAPAAEAQPWRVALSPAVAQQVAAPQPLPVPVLQQGRLSARRLQPFGAPAPEGQRTRRLLQAGVGSPAAEEAGVPSLQLVAAAPVDVLASQQPPADPFAAAADAPALAAAPAPEQALPGAPSTAGTDGTVPTTDAALLQQAAQELVANGGGAADTAFGQPQAGAQRTNFSSLVSLVDPPPGFQAPPLSPEQQANLPKVAQLTQGIATVHARRDVGQFGGVQLACSMGFLSPYFSQYFAALPVALYGGGERCGACVRVFCVDSICQDALVRNATFMVVDSCKECGPGDLLLSYQGFANASGVNVNISPKLRIAWAFESCAPLVEGGIRMLASPNNRANFLSLQFSNLRQPLRGVSVEGLELQRTRYGTWELNSPGRDLPLWPPLELALTGASGQRLTKALRTLASQDLGINFS